MRFTNRELAEIIVERLNELVTDEAVRLDIGTLINQRVGGLSQPTIEHANITVLQEADDAPCTLGVLGLINGIIGGNWEHDNNVVAAVFDDDDKLLHFKVLPEYHKHYPVEGKG